MRIRSNLIKDVTIDGINTLWSVSVSPRADIEDGLIWSVHIRDSDGKVRVRMLNTTASPIDPISRQWNFVATKVA